MRVNVTAYPYAVQFGEIDVPEHVENIEEYIHKNWDNIDFTEPDLDYAGTDFEFEIIKEENMKTEFCRKFGDDFGFEIIEHFGVLAKYKNGWSKELNLVAWNGGEAKYDIREWDPSHERMSRGVTLTADEMSELVKCVPTTHE